MKYTCKLITLLCILGIFNNLNTQNTIPPLTYLTTEKGLSQAINLDIFQDSKGIIWLTSYDGINKFDSYKNTKFTYDHNDSLTFRGNLTKGIVEDGKGNIWIGGNNFLNIYQYNQNKFKYVKVNGNNSNFYYPIFSIQNTLVFQNGNKFYKCDINTYEVKLLYSDDSFIYTSFSAKTFETPTSFVVFLGGRSAKDNISMIRIYEFTKDNLSHPKIESISTDNDFFAIQKMNDNDFIIGKKNGLNLYSLRSNKQLPFLSKKFNETVNAIAIYRDKFLISTQNGRVYELDLKDSTFVLQNFFSKNDEMECKKNGIQKIFVDKQDNVFFALWGKGVACYDRNTALFNYNFTHSDVLKNTISDQYITSVLHYKNDEIIVYSKSGDLYLVNSKGQVIQKVANIGSLNNTNFGGDIYLHKGFDNRVFVSGLDRLVEIKVAEKKVYPIQMSKIDLLNCTINDLAIFDFNHYIISTSKGIFIVSKDFKTISTFAELPSNENYTRTYFVEGKYLFVCRSYQGFDLYLYGNGKLKKLQSSQINASIKDIFVKNKSEFWFASTLGIIKYNIKTDKIELDNSKDKWINSYLYCLLPDTNNNLWISHNAGITKYNYLKNQTTHYNLSHGLQGNEFNTSAFAKTSNGILFFGGTNGLNSINPYTIESSKNKPIIQFEEIKISDKPIENEQYNQLGNSLVLDKNQTTFSLKPIIINYNSCFVQLDYLYRLEGIDKTWLSGQSNQIIRYSNLPAGKYKLIVKTPDNSQQKSIDVIVKQVFWKSFWFWLLVSLVGMFIIWLTQRGYYLAKVNKQEAEIREMKALEEERIRIAQDMHDDVGTGLSRIRYIINSIKMGETPNLDGLLKVTEISDDTITKMSEIIWALNKTNQSLEELLYFIRSQAGEMVENANINFEYKLPENIPVHSFGWMRNRNTYLLVKETINNAIKHAHAKTISLEFKINDQFLIIQVNDDGIGFDSSLTSKGNGLNNYRKRIEKLGGSYSLDSILNMGTMLTYNIPLE